MSILDAIVSLFGGNKPIDALAARITQLEGKMAVMDDVTAQIAKAVELEAAAVAKLQALLAQLGGIVPEQTAQLQQLADALKASNDALAAALAAVP